jgi:hypothetical protein
MYVPEIREDIVGNGAHGAVAQLAYPKITHARNGTPTWGS